jgi:hypothetical protein
VALAYGASILVIGATLFWTFVPASKRTVDQDLVSSVLPVRNESEVAGKRPIDAKAFATAKLWNPVPPPRQAEAPMPKEPAKPPRLQLVGIINENGVLSAALYDQDDDRLLIVASGDTIKDQTVVQITSNEVLLKSEHASHRLRLEVASS